MFNNIGGKIKGLAVVVTVIGILGSIVGGIVLIAIGEYMIPFGVILMIAGSLVSWVSSFLLYGFGQLVENSDVLAGRFISEKTENQAESNMESKTNSVAVYKSNSDACEKVKRDPETEERLRQLAVRHLNGDMTYEQYIQERNAILKEFQ